MMNLSRYRPHAQHGASIIEFMVSMTIGLIVLSAASYAYIANKSSFAFNDQDSRLRDRGRFIINILNSDLRLAGYQGCADKSAAKTRFADVPTEFKTKLEEGINVTSSGATTTELNIFAPAPGYNFALTDNLAKGAVSAVITPLTPDLTIESAGSGRTSFMLLDDCDNAQFVPAVFNASGAAVVLSNSKSTAYFFDKHSLVSKYDWGTSGSTYTGTSYTFADNKLTRNGVVLAENVDFFRVCVGLDTNGDGSVDQIGQATSATNFKKVITAQVDVVLSTDQSVLSDALSNSFATCGAHNIPAATEDKKLRRLFTTSVAIRNRVD